MANKAQLWRELTSEERIVVEVVAKHTKKKKQLDYDGGSDFSNFTQSDKKIQQTIFALLETEEANCKTFVVLSRDEGTYLFVIGRDGKWYATGNIVKDGLPSALKRFARDQVKTKPKKNLLWEVLSWYLFASAPIILIILSNKGEDRPVFVALVWVLWFLGLGAASVATSCLEKAFSRANGVYESLLHINGGMGKAGPVPKPAHVEYSRMAHSPKPHSPATEASQEKEASTES